MTRSARPERRLCGLTARSRDPGPWRGRAALFLAFLIASCALRAEPLSLVPHLAPRATPATAGPRIGVGPFRDRRLRISRERVRPPIRPIWLGIAREGENSTGDSSFAGSVTRALREDLAATLTHLGLFSEVRLVEEDALPADLDYLLVGDLEELVGYQYERFRLNVFLPTGLIDSFDPPVGTARVKFALRARRGRGFEDRVEIRVQREGISVEQMAWDALAMSHERFAQVLSRRIGRPWPSPRVVPVRLLDACGLGPKRARRVVADASEIFEREVGIKIEAVTETWAPPGSAGTVDALLESAEQRSAPKGGIVLALAPLRTSLREAARGNRFGLARQLGRHAVVICPEREPLTVSVAHEIAHLFGALHSLRRGSIMYPSAEFDGRFFDNVNRRILRISRRRVFGAPLEEETRSRLEDLYRRAAETPDEIDADSVTQGLATLM